MKDAWKAAVNNEIQPLRDELKGFITQCKHNAEDIVCLYNRIENLEIEQHTIFSKHSQTLSKHEQALNSHDQQITEMSQGYNLELAVMLALS